MLLHYAVLGTDIALKFILLFKFLIETYRTDLYDLPIQLPSDFLVLLRNRVHLQVNNDVFHLQSLLSKNLPQ